MNEHDEQPDETVDEGLEDTQIRRDTQVRGSLGIPPSGEKANETREHDREREKENPELDLDRMRNQSDLDDDDRMSER
jgi:hypothetical protein